MKTQALLLFVTLLSACGADPVPLPSGPSAILRVEVRNTYGAERDCRVGYNVGDVGGVEDHGTVLGPETIGPNESHDYAIDIPSGEIVTLMVECAGRGYPDVSTQPHAVSWTVTDPISGSSECVATYEEKTGANGHAVANVFITCS